jgi:hypothetical protein
MSANRDAKARGWDVDISKYSALYSITCVCRIDQDRLTHAAFHFHTDSN